MKIIPILLVSSSVFCCIPGVSFANDTTFGGSGALPMPMKQENIAMVGENITITGHDIDRPDMKGRWDYSCDYQFKNASDHAISFEMGFPFPINDELSETAVPAGFTTANGKSLVYDFKVTVDGKLVPAKATHMKPISDMDYTEAYVWPMTIQPHQTVNIHHHYFTGVTLNSMGYYYMAYVLKTGGLWKDGTIGHAVFTIIPNATTHTCSELNSDEATQPAGMQIVGEGKDRKYAWDLKNFQPKEDLNLCYLTAKNYIRTQVVFPVLGMGNPMDDLDKRSKQELRYLKNSVYAQYGKQFQDPELQTYFNKQWWYEVNPHYSDSMLSTEDKNAIAVIAKQETIAKS